jgi:hypothetical protein
MDADDLHVPPLPRFSSSDEGDNDNDNDNDDDNDNDWSALPTRDDSALGDHHHHRQLQDSTVDDSMATSAAAPATRIVSWRRAAIALALSTDDIDPLDIEISSQFFRSGMAGEFGPENTTEFSAFIGHSGMSMSSRSDSDSPFDPSAEFDPQFTDFSTPARRRAAPAHHGHGDDSPMLTRSRHHHRHHAHLPFYGDTSADGHAAVETVYNRAAAAADGAATADGADADCAAAANLPPADNPTEHPGDDPHGEWQLVEAPASHTDNDDSVTSTAAGAHPGDTADSTAAAAAAAAAASIGGLLDDLDTVSRTREGTWRLLEHAEDVLSYVH